MGAFFLVIPMIFMRHPKHGATHFYSENAAKEAEANGWVREDLPIAQPEEKPVTIAAREPEKRRPGRPRLNR